MRGRNLERRNSYFKRKVLTFLHTCSITIFKIGQLFMIIFLYVINCTYRDFNESKNLHTTWLATLAFTLIIAMSANFTIQLSAQALSILDNKPSIDTAGNFIISLIVAQIWN
jgi:hypothetical protein